MLNKKRMSSKTSVKVVSLLLNPSRVRHQQHHKEICSAVVWLMEPLKPRQTHWPDPWPPNMTEPWPRWDPARVNPAQVTQDRRSSLHHCSTLNWNASWVAPFDPHDGDSYIWWSPEALSCDKGFKNSEQKRRESKDLRCDPNRTYWTITILSG